MSSELFSQIFDKFDLFDSKIEKLLHQRGKDKCEELVIKKEMMQMIAEKNSLRVKFCLR